ncbi:hypothetical protein ACT8ZV_08260 [Nocardioides sp. MAHUQ-72]|uniref:hypothetical protein n=1 Tax=unclassified Nocardioides TaxID=2615069 RepID=UPI0036166E2D
MSPVSRLFSKRTHAVLLPAAVLALAQFVGPQFVGPELVGPDPEPTTSSSASVTTTADQPSTRSSQQASGQPSEAVEQRIDAAREAGCTMAHTALRATRDAKIPYYVGCAFLVQETGGGRNVFGHDPTVFAGAGKVTRAKYLAYKTVRERTGQMQGVGPMQLTWYSYQDRADRLGGAWKPYPNMLVGFRHLAALHRSTGSWTAAAHEYNGGGAAAEAYAVTMDERFTQMRDALA